MYSVKKAFSFFLCIFLLSLAFVFLPSYSFADTTSSLLPISEGNYLQWTPKSGSTHYTQVDETTCNGQTDFNHTSTVGERDSYGLNISSVPNGATITQIDITPCASRASSGGANPVLNLFYRLNGVNSSDAGAYSLTGTTPVVLGVTSFTGLSTVKSSTSTLEIGGVLTSGTKGVRLSQISTVITYTPLTAPSSLTATAGNEEADLSWTDNATTENGFTIERGTDGVTFTQIATVGANMTTYSDPNVIGLYYYRVKAYNSGGDSSYSNTANVTVALNAPSDLTSVLSGTTAALLNWTDNSLHEDGFTIERSTDSAHFVQINTVGANTTIYTDLALPSGTYYYRVRAYKLPSINSTYSTTASVVIP